MRAKGMAVFLLLSMFAASVLAPMAVASQPARAQWRYLVYLDADNNLDVSAGQWHVPVVEDDLRELMSVGSTREVVCYVLVDRWTGPANLFKVHKGWLEEVKRFPLNGKEANMGDPATLRSFVQYTYEASPAEHTVLMFWNHGSPLYVAYDENGLQAGVPDELTHWEVFYALQGYRVDVIGTDECLVGQVEVAYEYATSGVDCDYLLASETYTGWRGYPYDRTLGALVANPWMTPAEVAMMFIDQVSALLSEPPYMSEVVNCHAAIDLNMMRSLASSFGELCHKLAQDMGSYVGLVSRARGHASYAYGAAALDLVDFREFVATIGSMARSGDVRGACAEVLEAFDSAVIALQASQALDHQVWGLGLCFPSHPWEVPEYYPMYGFGACGWSEFLEAFWEACGAT